jgi:hypothetical protein
MIWLLGAILYDHAIAAERCLSLSQRLSFFQVPDPYSSPCDRAQKMDVLKSY